MWSYTVEQVKLMHALDVDILHRVENPPIRMKPRAGTKPTMPDGSYYKGDLEPDRDAFGEFQMEGPPKHWAELRDRATQEIYIKEWGSDAQEATEKALAALQITDKPKTKAQKIIDAGAQAHKTELDIKDQQIADLTKRLDDLTARVLAGEVDGDVEVPTAYPAANGGTGVMVAKAKIKG